MHHLKKTELWRKESRLKKKKVEVFLKWKKCLLLRI